MATKKELCRSASGVFVRNLGWKVTPTGGYVQHKFYLGRDESSARLSSVRLERLWAEASKRWTREKEFELSPTDRPVWEPVTLAIADAIRQGQAVARVALPTDLAAMIPESPLIGAWLEKLQKDISVIKVELFDETAQQKSAEYRQWQGQRLLEMGREMLHRKTGGETLYSALDAFLRWAETKYVDVDKRPTLFASRQKRAVAFFKRHVADCSLAELDTRRIEDILEILRLRPNGKRGRPVSVAFTQDCMKQFRRFLRWLNKSPEFSWKRPSDLELLPMRIPLTPGERTGLMRSAQVQTYTLDELHLLWKYGTPFHRLLLLLALNGGFGKGEIGSLELADIHLHQKHPHERDIGYASSAADSWIFRMRHKTGVYAEFKLWAETVQAIEWWLQQRERMTVAPGVTTLLVNHNGLRHDTRTKGNNPNPQIQDTWYSLTKKIQADHPAFRPLSFNKLRKTAGNLIRAESHGEIAAVFLSHGRPVKSDELLDLYTNRPFAKVFAALDGVGEKLRPLWSGVADPFPENHRETKQTLSRATIRRVHALKRQGFKVASIAETLSLSQEAVRCAYRRQLSEMTES